MKKALSAAIVMGLMLSGARLLAETIELVTYYPATAGGNLESDRIHAGRVTIGDPYSLDNPADADLPNGTLLVADRVGIGTPAPQGPLHVVGLDDEISNILIAGSLGVGSAAPQGPLHVVGLNDAWSNVLFMPGNDTGEDGLPGVSLGLGTVPGALDGGNGGDPEPYLLHVRRDQPAATRVMVQNAGNTGWAHSQIGVVNDTGWIGYIGAMGTSFPMGLYSNNFLVASRMGRPLVLSAEEAGGQIRFYTEATANALNDPAVEKMRITAAGNVGIGTAAPQTPAPNGRAAGNIDVNDVYLRSAGRWMSQGSPGETVSGTFVGAGFGVRTVSLGFSPKAVYVIHSSFQLTKFASMPDWLTLFVQPGGAASNFSNHIRFTADGFEAQGLGSATTFYYLAVS